MPSKDVYSIIDTSSSEIDTATFKIVTKKEKKKKKKTKKPIKKKSKLNKKKKLKKNKKQRTTTELMSMDMNGSTESL